VSAATPRLRDRCHLAAMMIDTSSARSSIASHIALKRLQEKLADLVEEARHHLELQRLVADSDEQGFCRFIPAIGVSPQIARGSTP
jgi:hypothetical protein